MRRAIMSFFIILLAALAVGCKKVEDGDALNISMEDYLSQYTYQNTKNILPTQGRVGITGIGDPHVFWDEATDKYYMTGTYNGSSLYIWSSDDLTTWDSGNEIINYTQVQWAAKTNPGMWGAEIHKKGDTYYLYYSAWKNDVDSPRIGVATANTVTGPYTDKGEPLFDFGFSTIDNHLFVDSDNTPYFVFVRDALDNVVNGVHESHIYIVKVNDDWMSTEEFDNAVLLLKPDQSWEMVSGGNDWKWVEGPWIHKHEDKYYLFYSANKFSEVAYAIGYAVSASPMGPYVKNNDNPLIYSMAEELTGPGNNSFFYSKDHKELFTAYHMHTNYNNPSGNRFLNIDRIGFRDDGSVYFNGPSISNQPLPSGANQYHNLISKDANIEISSTLEGFNKNGINDGEVVYSAKNERYQWVANDSIEKSYVKISWDKEQTIYSIYIYQPLTVKYRSSKINIEFSNDYKVNDVTLSQFIGEPSIIIFNEVKAGWVKVTVAESGFGQQNFGLNEIMIFGK
ncbi:MAG: glycoside hydrolase family 43 protein [Bacilli bacterium]|nr:glycoside hydrolase family 43 protein [Bacilli bacterium]